MKHLSILVPNGNAIADTITGAYNLFEMANNFGAKNGRHNAPFYQIDLVGTNTETKKYNGFLGISPTQSIHDIKKTDLIIIPGLVGNMARQIEMNKELVDWIRSQRITNQSEIASLCRGAFLLAETGLMNNKQCATHWLTHNTFKEMFPKVKLAPDKVISDDNGIYSSGGAYSFLSLLLYMIEKFYGRETAIWCAKVSEIEFNRNSQNEFIIFKGQKSHADESVLKVQEHIEQHFGEKLSVEHLAELVATSSRNLVRRFKKATKNTPIEYIQRVRIEAAKKMLESSTLNVQGVMFDCGYNDDKTFRTIFKRYVGLTPNEYRNKYSREMALI